MSLAFSIPSTTYAAGLYPLGPFPVGAGFSDIALTLTRESWPDSGGHEIIEILAQYSTDSGVTWSIPQGFGAAGGTLPPSTKTGLPQDVSGPMHITFPSPCLLKASVNIQQGLRTAVGIVVT